MPFNPEINFNTQVCNNMQSKKNKEKSKTTKKETGRIEFKEIKVGGVNHHKNKSWRDGKGNSHGEQCYE